MYVNFAKLLALIGNHWVLWRRLEVGFPLNDRLLTIDEVAEYLGVHRDTVYNLVRGGVLPGLSDGWAQGRLAHKPG